MRANAAVAIWCDVAAAARDEFRHWHAHEHMPERLSIPGFVRGSRWESAEAAGEGNFMLYEAHSEAAITAGPYLHRLDNPTPWSRQMMPHHRNMVRSLCRVDAAFGAGLGHALLTLRFSPQDADRLQHGLTAQLLPALASRRGLVAARLMRHIARPATPQTTEQQLRGGDAAADWIVLVNGYSAEAVASVAAQELSESALLARGAAPGTVAGLYRLAFVLTEEQ